MFYKKLESGKYRFFEKFFDEHLKKWRQVTVTMNSKSRVSQSEARDRLSQKIDLIQSTADFAEEETNLTIQEVFDDWQKIRKEELKPSTFHVGKMAFNTFLKRFGEMDIKEINPTQIQSFLFNSQLSPSTRRLRKNSFNLLFTYAKNVGYIEVNPIERVVLPKEKNTIEELKKKQNKFLNLEEMRIILEKNKPIEKDIRKLLIYEFLFLTGLRIGEVQALRWEDVDFEKKTLAVTHTLNHQGTSEKSRQLLSPKTINSYRAISINDRCLEILNYFYSHLTDESFIFVNKHGDTYCYSILARHFKKVCQVLGEETSQRKYTLHMLRHSHISLLIEMGIPIKTIMERVGHSNEQMILQIYSHVTKKMEEDLANKLKDFSVL
ncbi:tyrosine-type recombinase/integrase [Lactococcus lactis]|nr:site-specific integrase [Lactococcus lactis]MDG4974722.1 site-specific integrase [Lactococcus lactis]MDT2884917.1 tyrosine-type recombinase/integrase [Lactococcus lactis]MDT2922349.1 tyrosine-type recombinase/integrase [Lactococcus lactis]MDT2941384.1 tyrosine-type recombinase/integrase [Lactococcus lactis]